MRATDKFQTESSGETVRDGAMIYYRARTLAAVEDSEREKLFSSLAAALKVPQGASDGMKAGRGAILRHVFSHGRVAIIRLYRRGGFVARFNSRFFCSSGVYRPIEELNVLTALHARSLAVPEPIACLVRSSWAGFFYSGSIATWEIPHALNLLSLITLDEYQPKLEGIARAAGSVARAALDAGIEHGDLHLGNILLAGEKVFLVDWDNSRTACSRSAETLDARFRRSVKKHQVRESVADAYRQGLEGQ